MPKLDFCCYKSIQVKLGLDKNYIYNVIYTKFQVREKINICSTKLERQEVPEKSGAYLFVVKY